MIHFVQGWLILVHRKSSRMICGTDEILENMGYNFQKRIFQMYIQTSISHFPKFEITSSVKELPSLSNVALILSSLLRRWGLFSSSIKFIFILNFIGFLIDHDSGKEAFVLLLYYLVIIFLFLLLSCNIIFIPDKNIVKMPNPIMMYKISRIIFP